MHTLLWIGAAVENARLDREPGRFAVPLASAPGQPVDAKTVRGAGERIESSVGRLGGKDGPRFGNGGNSGSLPD